MAARALFALRSLGLLPLLLFALVDAKVPSYIQVCGRRNPKIDECIQDSVTKLMPKLRSGIPELDVPPLEPLNVDRIPLADLDTFKAIATNVKLSGLSNFKLTKLVTDFSNKQFIMEVTFPKIIMDADYDVEAKILVPIKDKGFISTVTEDVLAKVTLKYELVERKGRTLIYFPTMTTKLTIKDYEAEYRPGAADKDNPVSQAINSVLTNSRYEIIESMTPNIEKAISKKVLELSNRICKHFTYDELFPDRP